MDITSFLPTKEEIVAAESVLESSSVPEYALPPDLLGFASDLKNDHFSSKANKRISSVYNDESDKLFTRAASSIKSLNEQIRQIEDGLIRDRELLYTKLEHLDCLIEKAFNDFSQGKDFVVRVKTDFKECEWNRSFILFRNSNTAVFELLDITKMVLVSRGYRPQMGFVSPVIEPWSAERLPKQKYPIGGDEYELFCKFQLL